MICVRYLGDTLLLRPALRALRTAFPGARIDAVVAAGTGVALDDCSDVSRVIEWPGGRIWSQIACLGGLGRAGYDWAVDFTGNDRTALIALCSRAARRVAYERPKLPWWSLRRLAYNLRPAHKKSKPHALVQRLELLEACGVPPQGTACDLAPRQAAVERVRARMAGMPPSILHAHVTSRDMQKAIPAEVVRRVIEAAAANGMGVVMTVGRDAAEREHVAKCSAGFPETIVRVLSDLDWHELVAAISLCRAYWGADTAPAHIASALKKKMLIHFGPSRADHWRPLHEGGNADVQSCACLKAKKSTCPRGEPGNCLKGIEPAAVIAWLKS